MRPENLSPEWAIEMRSGVCGVVQQGSLVRHQVEYVGRSRWPLYAVAAAAPRRLSWELPQHENPDFVNRRLMFDDSFES